MSLPLEKIINSINNHIRGKSTTSLSLIDGNFIHLAKFIRNNISLEDSYCKIISGNSTKYIDLSSVIYLEECSHPNTLLNNVNIDYEKNEDEKILTFSFDVFNGINDEITEAGYLMYYPSNNSSPIYKENFKSYVCKIDKEKEEPTEILLDSGVKLYGQNCINDMIDNNISVSVLVDEYNSIEFIGYAKSVNKTTKQSKYIFTEIIHKTL